MQTHNSLNNNRDLSCLQPLILEVRLLSWLQTVRYYRIKKGLP